MAIIKSEILSIQDEIKWNQYLRNLPKPLIDIYYTPEYYSLYENLGEGKAQCFVFEKDGCLALYPFLLNSVNNLGYDLVQDYYDIQGAYGYNGIISNNYSHEFRSLFYCSFDNYCKKNNIIAEFTRYHPILKNHSFSDGFMILIKDRNTIYLDLSKSYDEIWFNDYSSKNRNMIRKARNMKFGINVWEKPSDKNILEFVNMYQNSMRRINADKYFLFDSRYFIDLFKNISSNSILFEVVNAKNEIECATIIFNYGIYVQYHLSCRKSDSDNSVNNFILDEVIKYAISRDMKYFHLGGGTSSDNNDPLYKFKANFSKGNGEFYIGKKVHNPQIYESVIQQWSMKNIADSKRLLKYRKINND